MRLKARITRIEGKSKGKANRGGGRERQASTFKAQVFVVFEKHRMVVVKGKNGFHIHVELGGWTVGRPSFVGWPIIDDRIGKRP